MDEEEEDVDNDLSKFRLPSVFTRTQNLGIYSDGFFNDNQGELVPHDLPHSSVSSGGNLNDEQAIDNYIKSLKRRAQGSNRVGSSSTQDKRPELWMLPVPVRSFHIY